MYIFKTVQDLQHYIRTQKKQTKKIGLVPTMGALHLGHLSLIQRAFQDCDLVVCSIFVNPTQFGDAEDLEKYPRPIESDIEKLEKIGCSALFLPDVTEVYPKDLISPTFDLSGLDKTMEGAHRPGHFAGVVEVVHRLLDIAQPDCLYMGQKDYQQFAIIKHMLGLMNSSIQLVRVPIVREEDGLAMSSRNVRLSPEGRIKAQLISQMLFEAKKHAIHMSLEEVKQQALAFINQHQLEVDYFTIIDGDSLEIIDSFDKATIVTACTTVRVDGVRLLDNIILRESI
ncbi:pantoate--beta-alanine ligase [Aureispira sp. CCB-E]|uniref:pantoate--beta-alanine ligase n=1 Tax=Aureispira sp. CCB-E TaxID=3051121 RepID=UPI0028683DE2|nr:pantoate--beta-alanine ligase [Aureispira sp. CCB-E]WMX15682.1 pantoate--beta-alanine ligase [Aureispira sp. CCB-E]